jgi:hypothetical protein
LQGEERGQAHPRESQHRRQEHAHEPKVRMLVFTLDILCTAQQRLYLVSEKALCERRAEPTAGEEKYGLREL